MTNLIRCPGCGLTLPSQDKPAPAGYHASGECFALLEQLAYYSLSLGDTNFIHQLIVDAYAAQHSGMVMKNIRTIFSLIGIYLAAEKLYTGQQIQRVHMIIPKQKWDHLKQPESMSNYTVMDVLNTHGDVEREIAIKKWVASVWKSWTPYHDRIRNETWKYLLN